MDEAWLNEVQKFLAILTQVQDDLQHTFELKRLALIAGDNVELPRLNAREEESIRRFQLLERWRTGLIEQATQVFGRPFKSLQDVVFATNQEQGALRDVLKETSRRSARLQQQSWAIWILANQASRHFETMLEVIHRRGERNPTYGKSGWGERTGGAILDSVV